MSRPRALVTDPVGAVTGTVVAVPGLAESAATLAQPARHWASRGLRVLAVDPLGHGDAPRFTPAQLLRRPGDVIVDDLLAWFDGLLPLVGPVVVFGHSAGGSAAAALAAARADRVAAVVLEDPFWRLPVTPHQDRAVARTAADMLRRQQAMSDTARRAECAAEHPGWAADEVAGWADAKTKMDVALVAQGDVIPGRPWPVLLRDLADAAVPVLIVTGSHRIGITADHRAIARAAGAEVVVVPGAGHFVRRDESEGFLAVVDGFLDRAIAAVRAR